MTGEAVKSSVAVSVHQPNFMPWLKLFDKILASDVYVAYDTVQYTKTEYHARQKIKRKRGSGWLSVPVLSIRGTKQFLQEVRIDNTQPFRARHLRLLHDEYRNAPYFDDIYDMLGDIYRRDQEFLVDFNLDVIEAFCRYVGSGIRIVRASSLPHNGDPTDRLIQLVQQAGGDLHLTSSFGADLYHVDWPRMHRAGIAIRNQEFQHPVYEQLWGEFIPNLAAVDMLFNTGPATRQMLEATRDYDDVIQA